MLRKILYLSFITLVVISLLFLGYVYTTKSLSEDISSLQTKTGESILNQQKKRPLDQKSPKQNPTANENLDTAKEQAENQEITVTPNSGSSETKSNQQETNINYDFSAVGELGENYLNSSKFKRLVIEVDYEESSKPSSNSLEYLKSTIAKYADKPNGIIFSEGNSFDKRKEEYSISDLLEIQKNNRKLYTKNDQAVIHIIYINGKYSNNESALGVAINSSTFVIFEDQISSATTALIQKSEIEKAVLVHEFGHLLGLVNINYTSEFNHEDTSHRHHSNNKESVMYWAVEDLSISNILAGGPPKTFDTDDEKDIKKIKGN